MSRWKDLYGVLIEIAPGACSRTRNRWTKREHFYVCALCGQAVDMRQHADVFYHDTPGHDPLPVQ
jgi:hypothetical protein